MLPQNKPDRIRILFDDHRLVANAGLLLPATLARHLGLRELVDHHLDLGGAPGRANTGDKMLTLVASALAGGFSCDSRDVIRVCEPCQGFVRRCKRCRRFHLVYQGQGGEYSMPWWVSESWLKEHGCTRRDFGRRAHTVRVDACWKRTPKCLTSPLTGRSMGNRDATS